MFVAVDTELHQAFGPFDSEEQAKTWLKRMQPTRTVDPDYWAFYEVECVAEDWPLEKESRVCPVCGSEYHLLCNREPIVLSSEDLDEEPPFDNPFDSAYGGGSYSSHPNL